MYLQTLARIVAGNLGIRVINSPTAKTFQIGLMPDGELVIFMASQILAVFDGQQEKMEKLIRGAIAHEALGHGYHTDMTVKGKTPFSDSLVGILEDVRVERLAPSRYPGAARSLCDLITILDQDVGFISPPQDCSEEQALLIGLLRHFRTEVLRQPLGPDVTMLLLDKARDWMGSELFIKIEAIARQACYSAHTQDVANAADEIVDLLKAAKQPPEQDPSPQKIEEQEDEQEQASTEPEKGQDGSEGGAEDQGVPDEQESAEEGEEDPAGAEDGDDQGNASGESPPNNKPEGEGRPGGDGEGVQAGEADPSADERGEGRADAGSGSSEDAEEGSGEMVTGPALRFDSNVAVDLQIETATEAMIENSTKATDIDGTMTDLREAVKKIDPESKEMEVKGIIQRMRSRLEDALRSITEDEEDDEVDSGRLDTTRIARTAAGLERNPFLIDGRPGRGISTELVVMFDASGSMSSLGVDFLRTLVYATGCALASQAPNFLFNIAFFNTNSSLVHSRDTHWTPKQGARVTSLYSIGGGTSWAQSATPMTAILARSRKERKVLLTVTDGDINHERYPGVMQELDSYGIEAPFLSIGKQLPIGLMGRMCDATPESFAKTFTEAILAAISPEFA